MPAKHSRALRGTSVPQLIARCSSPDRPREPVAPLARAATKRKLAFLPRQSPRLHAPRTDSCLLDGLVHTLRLQLALSLPDPRLRLGAASSFAAFSRSYQFTLYTSGRTASPSDLLFFTSSTVADLVSILAAYAARHPAPPALPCSLSFRWSSHAFATYDVLVVSLLFSL